MHMSELGGPSKLGGGGGFDGGGQLLLGDFDVGVADQNIMVANFNYLVAVDYQNIFAGK